MISSGRRSKGGRAAIFNGALSILLRLADATDTKEDGDVGEVGDVGDVSSISSLPPP